MDTQTEDGGPATMGHNPFTLISLLRATACDPITEDACEEDLADELEKLSGGVAAADILLCAQKDYTVSNLRLAIQLAKVDKVPEMSAERAKKELEYVAGGRTDGRNSVPHVLPPTEKKKKVLIYMYM